MAYQLLLQSKKWADTGLFFIYFRLFQTNVITILQQINVKKCPSGIQCRDLNPRPSERESLPITTRPGLVPRQNQHIMLHICNQGLVVNKAL